MNWISTFNIKWCGLTKTVLDFFRNYQATSICGKQHPTWLPMTPYPHLTQHSYHCVIPSVLVLTGSRDSLLINRIRQCNGVSLSRSGYTSRAPTLLMFSLAPSQLAFSDEAHCCVGRAHVARNWGWPGWQSSETEALNPTACERLNPASNHVSELKSRSFPTWALWWDHSPGNSLTAPFWETPEQRTSVSHARIPGPQEVWHNQWVPF